MHPPLPTHQRSGAYISALVNDGTIEYDHDADGTHQEMASCNADFRNKDFNTYARLIYRQRVRANIILLLYTRSTPSLALMHASFAVVRLSCMNSWLRAHVHKSSLSLLPNHRR
jgi:hypothetical protein